VCVGGTQSLVSAGTLSDIAPTMLAMLGIEKPSEMTGHSLLKSN
jgi:2,3-bisphosphoglycerate-independent phosphoglycerate mutase